MEVKNTLIILFGLLFVAPVNAESFADGEAVMQAAHEQSRQYPNQYAEVQLEIQNEDGKARTRDFRMWHKILVGRTKSLLKFHQPASVRGTGLLSETLDDANIPTQWIYLPALRSVKRLNADDQNKSFVGSDFTNGDVAGRQVARDKHRITSQDDENIYIESVPHDQTDLYSRLEVTMLRKILVPSQIVFYDRDGKKLKTLTNTRITKIKNMYMVSEAIMTNLQNGGSSTMRKSAINLDRAIPETKVGIKGLRR